MWVVIYGRHWVYAQYREHRYETAWWILAVSVYLWWHCRYSLSVYPVKYVKMYKANGNLLNFNSYSASYVTRKRKRR